MKSNTITPIWRNSDSRLIKQAFTTLSMIVVLGLIIAGLYFITPPPVQVLGSQTSSSGK